MTVNEDCFPIRLMFVSRDDNRMTRSLMKLGGELHRGEFSNNPFSAITHILPVFGIGGYAGEREKSEEFSEFGCHAARKLEQVSAGGKENGDGFDFSTLIQWLFFGGIYQRSARNTGSDIKRFTHLISSWICGCFAGEAIPSGVSLSPPTNTPEGKTFLLRVACSSESRSLKHLDSDISVDVSECLDSDISVDVFSQDLKEISCLRFTDARRHCLNVILNALEISTDSILLKMV